eukprot:5297009-Amphidinium_carterae.1
MPRLSDHAARLKHSIRRKCHLFQLQAVPNDLTLRQWLPRQMQTLEVSEQKTRKPCAKGGTLHLS